MCAYRTTTPSLIPKQDHHTLPCSSPQILAELGGWTLTGNPNPFDPVKWHLQAALDAARLRGADPFFTVGVTVDNKNSDMQLIAVRTPTSLSLFF